MDMSETTPVQPRYPVRWLIGLVVTFICVHIGYYALGIVFEHKTLISVMHFLEPELLRTRLLESIFYFHIQPPLMNLFVGLVLKITPESAWLFHGIYLLCGLTLYLCTFLLQLRLNINHTIAAVLSTLFMASPSFILWEHILLYTLPCAALLALAALVLFDVLNHGKPWALALFFGAILLLCGIRSMFHIGYFVLVLAALVCLCKTNRRRVLVAGLIPLLILFGFYFKNLLVFGEFTACTFVEKNLWIMTTGNMEADEKTQLIQEGKLSELSWINRWASLKPYPERFRQVPEKFADIPALTRLNKADTGEVNYNHYGNIALCNVYGKDARYVLFHYPRVYLKSVSLATYRYFISSSALPVSPNNKDKIKGIATLYDALLYGRMPAFLSPDIKLIREGGYPPHLFLLLGLPLVFAYGLWSMVRRGTRLNRTQRLMIGFLCFNILMVAVLGCALDFAETARYRFMTDALYVVLLGLLLDRLLALVKPVPVGDQKTVIYRRK
jgi:hypothetical protein